jgi:hypothetical protein
MRRRRLLVVGGGAAVVVAVVVVAAVSGGGGGPQRYETEVFSFDYPQGWEQIEGVEFPLAESVGDTGVGEDVVGIDLDNWIMVYSRPDDFGVTSENVGQLLPGTAQTFRMLADPAKGGAILVEPYVVEVDDLPGVRLRVRQRTARGRLSEGELTQFFAPGRAVVVNCQSTPEREQEVALACDQVLASFSLTGQGAG